MTPVLFVSHGAPNLEIVRPPVCSFLQSLSGRIPRPQSIICVSAHWETDGVSVSGASRPETIHDFYGFDPALYELTYAAHGSPGLAGELRSSLATAGIEARVDAGRGLDHGAWVPLRLIYPDADVPVLQLSIQPDSDPRHHFDVGRVLSPFRRRGVMILASGSATHNLRAFHGRKLDSEPVEEARAFDGWLTQCLESGDHESLLEYRHRGPHAAWNHPTADHILPLFVALGAAADDPGFQLHQSFTYGVLSMSAYAWSAARV